MLVTALVAHALAVARPMHPSRLAGRTPPRAACLLATFSEPEPPVRSILDLDQFQRVKAASEVVAVAAQRARGRGKEANDVVIREILEAPCTTAAIQLHFDWVSSLKFLRGLQVRIEACEAEQDARGAHKLSELMRAIRAEVQARMDASQRLISTRLADLAADPLAMRALARRGLLDEPLVMMLVANAAEAGKRARELAEPASRAGPADGGAAARLEALLQRLAQEAMRELDLPVAPEFVILRRLLQMRAPAARTELAARAAAGDHFVSRQAIDLEKLLEVVREFRGIEETCDTRDADVVSKLAVVEREVAALVRNGTGGSAM
ncbi:hypothetical protein KFE25_003402 [Diacronema lutheri]|uniref:Uncharacterized protein n=2 Tax=Diacronema lutheri TaxID=2081491 RepID=A0A8J5XHU7_DIALT|nr:hypothetical protein KFE25_003402 [Diacronema lutheri]